MLTCGIDTGSRATKAIILGPDGVVLGRGHRLTGSQPVIAAEEALAEALLAAKVERTKIDSIGVTGYARRLIPEQGGQFTAVSCHAAGAHHAFPKARNVLDIGALRSTAIRLDENGRVHRFRLNDRCWRSRSMRSANSRCSQKILNLCQVSAPFSRRLKS
jgi:activator of 2-hydroxyglutaryl-CoA dehydratase